MKDKHMKDLKHKDFEKHNDDYEVTVLMRLYNDVGFIENTINSVLNQKTNFKFQLIIADDFSTDGSIELVTEIASQHDNMTLIVGETHQGVVDNHLVLYNQILHDVVDTKYIASLDSDDYWINDDKLQKQYDILESNPDTVVTACSYHFGENRQILHEDKIHDDLFFSQTSTIFFRNVIDFYQYPGILRDDSGYRFIYHLYGKQISTSDIDVYYRTYDREEDKHLSSLYASQDHETRRRYNYYVIAIGFAYMIHHKIDYNILNFDKEGFSEFIINWAKGVEYGENLVTSSYVSENDRKYLEIIKNLDISTLPPRDIKP